MTPEMPELPSVFKSSGVSGLDGVTIASENGQKPDVKVRIRFEFGDWDAKVSIAQGNGDGEVIRLIDVSSFDDAVAKIRPILEKHGIK